MSLRAKIEAVIYAAEEPVTLVQLSALFAAEALEERAIRSAQSAQSASGGAVKVAVVVAPESTSFQTAEDAADAHAATPTSDADIQQASEHPEQVSATGPDGFAGEAERVSADHEPSGAGNSEISNPGQSVAGAGPDHQAGLGNKTAGEAGNEAADETRRAARQRDREVRDEIRRALDELIAEYDRSDRGMEIREIAGGYRVATRPEYHDAVRGFVKSLKPPMKLTLQALETLAVIAYKQPVTAPEVSEIRGVDSGGVLGSLISRKLVTTAGRKQVIGRPILYKTTKEFLLRFGLKDIAELPSMEEFEKMAGELVESEPAEQPGIPAKASTSVQFDLTSSADESGDPADADSDAEAAGLPKEAAAQETNDLEASLEEREVPMHIGEPAETNAPVQAQPESGSGTSESGSGASEIPTGPVAEPATAAEVQSAPELAEALEAEELAANARANVQVDDESEGWHDLAGVTRDTAGRINIDSYKHPHVPGADDEEY